MKFDSRGRMWVTRTSLWHEARDLYRDKFILAQQVLLIDAPLLRSPALASWLVSNEMPLCAGSDPSEAVAQ